MTRKRAALLLFVGLPLVVIGLWALDVVGDTAFVVAMLVLFGVATWLGFA